MCRYDVRAWLVWTLVAAFTATVARNPMYTLTILLVSRIVAQSCIRPGATPAFSFWRFALLVMLFSAAFSALFVHLGETTLLVVPTDWPLFGGAITLEAVIAGMVNGLAILALMSVFMTVNSSVPINDLARLTPRAFNDLGIVVLVALTYVPETARHLNRIREAQAVRGHRLAGLRDWRPIMIPLLIGGLERAMTLAEVMVARGYGSATVQRQSSLRRAITVVSLLMALAGWAVALWIGWPGWVMLLGAGLLLAFMIWQAGRQVKHTSYRPDRWRMADSGLVVTSLAVLTLLLLMQIQRGSGAFIYLPYPRLSWPPFEPVLGMAILLLLFPAVGNRLFPQ